MVYIKTETANPSKKCSIVFKSVQYRPTPNPIYLADKDFLPGGGRHARFGRENPLKVERIGRAHGDRRAGRMTAEMAQQLDRVGQCELLAGKPGHDPPAADL